MLEEYMDIQPVAHKIILNQIKKDNISHAYIIETNGYYKGFDYTKAIVKSLLCPQHNINLTNCGNCTQCQRIDDNNYTELEIIEPDGLWIKKEQLSNLQKNFSSKSVEGKKKIYIINHAEQLNESAANSILKFIEEPESGIIAFLVVENCANLLETIVSRCQKIKLINVINSSDNTVENICNYLFDSADEIEQFKKFDSENNIVQASIDFIKNYEEIGLDIILRENKYCAQFLKDKNLFEKFLNILLIFYKDVLDYKLYQKTNVFIDCNDAVNFVASKNEINNISRKINAIMNICERLKNNCNLNLLLDKLIIVLEGE